MIININNKITFKPIKILFLVGRNILSKLLYRKMLNNLFQDSKQLNLLFRNKYPRFRKDIDGNISCVSCDLCEDVCPTNAIKVEKANLMNFPSSLKTGEAPLHFYLDTTLCNKCRLCAEVCLVDALELRGEFDNTKVDLVKSELKEKVDL